MMRDWFRLPTPFGKFLTLPLLIASWMGSGIGLSLAEAAPSAQPAPTHAPLVQPLESDPMRRSGALVERCPGLSKDVRRYREAVLNPMRDWASDTLAAERSPTVLYPFSGPDIATAVALFEHASRFILVARQAASVAQLQAPDETVEVSECELHRFVMRTGFYRTHDLDGKDRPTPRLLALLLMSLETAGIVPTRVGSLHIDPNGTLLHARPQHVATDIDGHFRPAGDVSAPAGMSAMATDSESSGVRIEGLDDRGRTVVIDYLSMDLSDRGLRTTGREHKWIEGEMGHTVLIKSASHLLQSPNFSNLARLIAHRSRRVVQDETGLDVLKLSQFDQISVYGGFTDPYELWRESVAMGRLRAFVQHQIASETPPFPFGYRKPAGTFIMIATGVRQ